MARHGSTLADRGLESDWVRAAADDCWDRRGVDADATRLREGTRAAQYLDLLLSIYLAANRACARRAARSHSGLAAIALQQLLNRRFDCGDGRFADERLRLHALSVIQE